MIFSRPIPLLLLFLLPWLGRKWRSNPPAFLTGLLTVVLVILALAGLSIPRPVETSEIVVVWDGSASAGWVDPTLLESILTGLYGGLSEGDRLGLIQYGREALLQGWASPPDPPPSLRYTPDPGGSQGLAQALRVARARSPHGRILLATVGQLGDDTLVGYQPDQGHPPIDLLLLDPGSMAEGAIASLTAPHQVWAGQPFHLQVALKTWGEVWGILRLFRNDELVFTQRGTFNDGQVLEVPQTLQQGGEFIYRAEISALPDRYPQNNQAFTLVRALGAQKILVVHREGREVPWTQTMPDIQWVTTTTPGIPMRTQDLLSYGAVILWDISSPSLSPQQEQALQGYVAEGGGGLIALGGEEAFALGGYQRSLLDQILPLSSTPPSIREIPTTAIVLVIDRSGSMDWAWHGRSKMALANEAAIRLLPYLGPEDEIGVLSFASENRWEVPLGPLGDQRATEATIRSITAGGGTDLYPALFEAHQALLTSQAAIKHIIVLSDGVSLPGDFVGISSKIRRDGISLTTVGLGHDVDELFLQNLARMGGGLYYFTHDGRSLPEIFTDEAVRIFSSILSQDPFTPRVSSTDLLTQGISWGESPQISSHIITSLKPEAALSLQTPQGDPLLASWRYGLGRSLAFPAPWEPPFGDWEGSHRLLRAMLDYASGSQVERQIWITTQLSQGRLRITADGFHPDGRYLQDPLQITIRTPEGGSHLLTAYPVSPGRYEAFYEPKTQGVYLIRAEAGSLVGGARWIQGPPQAFLDLGGGELPQSLLQLSQATGGRVIGSITELGRESDRETTPHSLAPLLSLLAIFSLLFSLFLRIFSLPSRRKPIINGRKNR